MPCFSDRSDGLVLIPVLLLGLLLTACDKGPQSDKEAPASAPASEGEAAQTPVPGPVTGSEALPPGHPPFEGMPQAAPPIPADSTAMPAGHPSLPGVGQQPAADSEAPAHPVSSDKELAINLPENVMGKWSAVTFEITTADGSKETIEVALGSETSIQGSNLMLRADAFVPAYKSDFKTITSASNALDNPAAKVVLVENQEVVVKGWVFQKLPEFNSFSSDKISIRLVSATESGSSSDTQRHEQ